MTTSFSRAAAPSTLGTLGGDDLTGLFQAVTALGNRSALFAMLGCSIAGVLLSGLCTYLALYAGFFALIGGLCMLAGVVIGLNAAGLLLMDQAQGRASRTLGEALIGGAGCLVNVVLLGLGYLACVFVVALAIALLFALCKIPYLGPLLLFVVFPVSVVVVGVTQFVLIVCVTLALPALWEGEPLSRAVAGALQIARTRTVECVVLLVGLALVTGALTLFLFAILFGGLAVVGPLMGSMIGISSMIGMPALLGGGMVGAGGIGYAVALGVGSGLLFVLVLSVATLVYLLGLNLVYLRLTADLELDAELSLGAQIGRTADRAKELSRKARAAAARGGAASEFSDPLHAPTQPVPWSPPSVGPAETTMPLVGRPSNACPHCLSPIQRGDLFCGHCGEPVR